MIVDGATDITTPALVVDLGVLEHNLSTMATAVAERGAALRPHAKTHKCLPIARRQLAHGAAGLSVATVAEAETFAEGGIADLFIAYPVWADPERGHRLQALAGRTRLSIGADSVEGAAALGRALSGTAEVGVLVEIDCGHHRSGVAPRAAVDVARAVEKSGLALTGIFTFPGHSYMPGAATEAARDEAAALSEAAELLESAGFEVRITSGGSTPTARQTRPGVNELRPGVYAFNDAQQVALGTCRIEEVALVALGTVVSAPAPDRFILDTGSKILGADRPEWVSGHGLLPDFPGIRVSSLSEHHAVVNVPRGFDTPVPVVGERVRVIPNHVCNAVNLVDQLVVCSDGQTVDRWSVTARGANT
jgi:D-serine deaminase-like pyridoxal phosphate-dependent protein